MTMSEFDRTHIGSILSGHGTWFTAELLRLMAHADAGNFAKLQGAFPDVASAYVAWREAPYDGD